MLSYYKKAKDEGATIVTGGGIPTMPRRPEGRRWVQPTIWTGLPETASRGARGDLRPLLPHPPFDTEEEVLAHGQRHAATALATSIYTQDIGRASRLAKQIEVGPVLDQQLVPARPAHAVRRFEGSPASAARAACTRSSSTPSCAT